MNVSTGKGAGGTKLHKKGGHGAENSKEQELKILEDRMGIRS